jgi:hypothetical protein
VHRHLCDLSKSAKKKSRVQSGVLRADQVLDKIFNAGVGETRDKSLATRYVEYQFDAVGRMVGAKYICFGLDRNWLTGLFVFVNQG